jgi:hypothetical protein
MRVSVFVCVTKIGDPEYEGFVTARTVEVSDPHLAFVEVEKLLRLQYELPSTAIVSFEKQREVYADEDEFSGNIGRAFFRHE